MHDYESPVNAGEFVQVRKVDLADLLADVASVAPPEIVRQIVRTIENPDGEEVENPLHPENAERENTYYDAVYKIMTMNYLVNGVVVDWTDHKRELVRKKRDVLGEWVANSSDHMIYLAHIFTNPMVPAHLGQLAVAVQGVTFFDRESASRLARVFRSAAERARHFQLAGDGRDDTAPPARSGLSA